VEWTETTGATATGSGEAWEGDEQEMVRLQDNLALIPLVSNEIVTLMREDHTRRRLG
jgi:hypothetical protein